MNFPRRVIFGASASGVSAHIRRPENRILPVQAVSSLPVTGGLSESKVGAGGLDDYVQFQSAETSALGDYVDQQAAEAMTRGAMKFDASPTKTTVTAKVRGLHIGRRLTARVADAGLIGHSPATGAQQPSIQLAGNQLIGVRVDNFALNIKLNEALFNEFDTLDKLAEAFPNLPDPLAKMFFNPAGDDRSKTLPLSNGIVYCTVVESMEWEGQKHPDAEIEGNYLYLPNFGRVYFGGMLISANSRRVTMVRVQLGSPDGGEVVASEVEDPIIIST